MKVSILGTSNSVMKSGYLSYLEKHLDVRNYSSGRNSVFFHIKQLLKNYHEIASSDVIVVDNYINDLNFYIPYYADNDQEGWYFSHVEAFYKALSELGVPIVNLMFPISDIDSRFGYSEVKDIALRFG